MFSLMNYASTSSANDASKISMWMLANKIETGSTFYRFTGSQSMVTQL